MQEGLGSGDNMFSIYTDSFGVSNKLFYASPTRWCSDIVSNIDPDYQARLKFCSTLLLTDPNYQAHCPAAPPSNDDYKNKCPAGPVNPSNPSAAPNYPFYVNPSTDYWNTLTGRPTEPGFLSGINSIPSCPKNVDGPDNIPACFYDKGRGFKVSVAGTVIKPATQQFIYSPACCLSIASCFLYTNYPLFKL